LIAIRRGIGHFTDSHAIEHDPDNAPEHNFDCSIYAVASGPNSSSSGPG
jgi:hypothetical protein